MKTDLAPWAFWQEVKQLFQRKGRDRQSVHGQKVIFSWHWMETITTLALMRRSMEACITVLHQPLTPLETKASFQFKISLKVPWRYMIQLKIHFILIWWFGVPPAIHLNMTITGTCLCNLQVGSSALTAQKRMNQQQTNCSNNQVYICYY